MPTVDIRGAILTDAESRGSTRLRNVSARAGPGDDIETGDDTEALKPDRARGWH
jgi:hypothetical protein